MQKNAEKEEKVKAKQLIAEEKEKKRLARAAAKQEKMEKKEKKKGREEKSVADGMQAEPSTADAAESEPRPSKRQRRARASVGEGKRSKKPEEESEKPVEEEKRCKKPEEGSEKKDRRAEKAKEAFGLIQSLGIAELQTELGNRQSYTLKPPASAKDGAQSTIGVLLTTGSFYVSKNIVEKTDWPEWLSSLYKVGSGLGKLASVFLLCLMSTELDVV